VSDVIRQKIFNARVVFMELTPPHHEAFDHVGVLQNIIDKIPGLSPANDKLYFYFFSPSEKSFFLDEDFWIAREVIGHYQFSQEEPCDIFDLEQGDSMRVNIDIDMTKPDSFEKICQYEKHLRMNIGKKINLAPTWRLSFPWYGTFKGQLCLEFFPKVEG